MEANQESVVNQSYSQVLALEKELDQRSEGLAKIVNDLCMPVRNENREKWEKFAKTARLPIVGNLYFKIFKAPKGLRSEPDYFSAFTGHNSLKNEALEIYKKSEILESWKEQDLEHWGDEKVNAYFGWDYTGGYEHYHPSNPMPRREAYKIYPVPGGPSDTLDVAIPKKYDFLHSILWHKKHGVLSEGIFVMDKNTKQVVPLNKCDIEETHSAGAFGRLSKGISRSNVTYRYIG